jgi:hypothetical protein
MGKKKALVETEAEHVSEEMSGASPIPERSTRSAGSRKDTFLGEVVVVFVGLLLLAFAGFFVYLGYRVVETREDDRASIEVLSEQPDMTGLEETIAEATETAEPETEAEPEAPKEIDKATVEVAVLNGGAPGGTAGKVTKILSDAGFAKAEAGNADGTYSGVVIYHDADSEAVAEAVREALSETYDEIELAPADSEKKDTIAAPVTVIIAQ